MKKLFLMAYVLLSSFTLLAQVDSTAFATGIGAIGQFVAIVAPKYSGLALALTGLISTMGTLTLAWLHRRKTVNKWKKEGKLKD